MLKKTFICFVLVFSVILMGAELKSVKLNYGPVSKYGFMPLYKPGFNSENYSKNLVKKSISTKDLPAVWDWRAHNGVTSVKNQGVCGACYAFAILGDFEADVKIKEGVEQDYSENNIKGGTGQGCSGGNAFVTADYLVKHGVVLESDDPFNATSDDYNPNAPIQKVCTEWYELSFDDVGDTDVLKAAIYNYGPIYAALYAGDDNNSDWEDKFNSYDGSYVLNYPNCDQDPNHAIVIVGWDDNMTYDGGQGAWICKNSWGPSWGDNGYFYIAYGSAKIGTWGAAVVDYINYNSQEKVYYYDDTVPDSALGYNENTCWELEEFTPTRDEMLDKITFPTTDATTDVDIFIYDDFDPSTGTLSNLLGSIENLHYSYSGIITVDFNPDIPLTYGDSIYVVIKLENLSYGYPAYYDSDEPLETNKSFLSYDGNSWIAVDKGGDNVYGDLCIKIRTSVNTAANNWYLYQ